MAFSGGWRQCTALPIRSDSDGLLGVLDLHHKRKGQWPQHERTLVERVRHFLGSAVQRKAFEAQQRLAAEFPLVPLSASAPGETAERWAYADGGGEVGFI